ncbi:hypothetical protein K461DRAFT_157698 [Myriangium duriaei CBS 260.36]|uniref:Uncharacterized protein n=1 Tax=Myriangium duriaei CBS 260.36 TaxID=1168546 RepID=A0A9P4J0F7_9PEZI|nr:hypothetical protein K461DRAFT_157698 [Myriangium duriaei CBS 260.36]
MPDPPHRRCASYSHQLHQQHNHQHQHRHLVASPFRPYRAIACRWAVLSWDRSMNVISSSSPWWEHVLQPRSCRKSCYHRQQHRTLGMNRETWWLLLWR